MGRPKALLPFSGKETFLDHLLGLYAEIRSYPILVLNRTEREPILDRLSALPLSLTIAFNNDPDGDRLSSIIIGLSEAPRDTYVFVQDVDRPFVTVPLLASLIEHRHSTGYTAPDIGGHPPLLSPFVVRGLLRGANAGALHDALATFERTLIPAIDTGCDLNINTPEDYERHVAGRSPS